MFNKAQSISIGFFSSGFMCFSFCLLETSGTASCGTTGTQNFDSVHGTDTAHLNGNDSHLVTGNGVFMSMLMTKSMFITMSMLKTVNVIILVIMAMKIIVVMVATMIMIMNMIAIGL